MIGNSIGERNPSLAKKYYKLTAVIALSTCWISALLVYFGRKGVAALYFNVDSEVLDENGECLDEANCTDTQVLYDMLLYMIPFICIHMIADST